MSVWPRIFQSSFEQNFFLVGNKNHIFSMKQKGRTTRKMETFPSRYCEEFVKKSLAIG